MLSISISYFFLILPKSNTNRTIQETKKLIYIFSKILDLLGEYILIFHREIRVYVPLNSSECAISP